MNMKRHINPGDYFKYFGTSEIIKEIIHEDVDENVVLKITYYGVDYTICSLFSDGLLPNILNIKDMDYHNIYIMSPLTFTFIYNENESENCLIYTAFINKNGLVDERNFRCTDIIIEWNEDTIHSLNEKEYFEYVKN